MVIPHAGTWARCGVNPTEFRWCALFGPAKLEKLEEPWHIHHALAISQGYIYKAVNNIAGGQSIECMAAPDTSLYSCIYDSFHCTWLVHAWVYNATACYVLTYIITVFLPKLWGVSSPLRSYSSSSSSVIDLYREGCIYCMEMSTGRHMHVHV